LREKEKESQLYTRAILPTTETPVVEGENQINREIIDPQNRERERELVRQRDINIVRARICTI